ncbi:hypothetical protein [Streptomyces sp. I05A-00742]|uniref:hypothetical protein n=1 Tax=Streptomyces sp. I05A-00742 TaxID=2732853 RepID=UPI001489E9AF|nr:hypothetical protein [Streptomyces sp. I05A-00742]
MSARRRVFAAWAGLCLAGLAVTAALDSGSSADEPEPPGRKPTPPGAHAVDCRKIVDDVERQEASRPSTPPDVVIFRDWAVPEECADEFKARVPTKHRGRPVPRSAGPTRLPP